MAKEYLLTINNTLMEEIRATTQTAIQIEEHTLTGRLEAMIEREKALEQLLGVLDATLNRFRYEPESVTNLQMDKGQSINNDSSIFSKCDCIVYGQIQNELRVQSILDRLNQYL